MTDVDRISWCGPGAITGLLEHGARVGRRTEWHLLGLDDDASVVADEHGDVEVAWRVASHGMRRGVLGRWTTTGSVVERPPGRVSCRRSMASWVRVDRRFQEDHVVDASGRRWTAIRSVFETTDSSRPPTWSVVLQHDASSPESPMANSRTSVVDDMIVLAGLSRMRSLLTSPRSRPPALLWAESMRSLSATGSGS